MIEEVKLVIGMAVLQYGNLRIDPNQRRVYVNEQVVELTTMEFNILYYLALHPRLDFYPGAALRERLGRGVHGGRQYGERSHL